jgi:hypothetical protein
MPGDTLFAIGAVVFVLFIFGLKLGYSLKPREGSSGKAPAKVAVEA